MSEQGMYQQLNIENENTALISAARANSKKRSQDDSFFKNNLVLIGVVCFLLLGTSISIFFSNNRRLLSYASPAVTPARAEIEIEQGDLSVVSRQSLDQFVLSSTSSPTVRPTMQPSLRPSIRPTVRPSMRPTVRPTVNPSRPSSKPSQRQSVTPTLKPSLKPTTWSTLKPTTKPTVKPTTNPTIKPTTKPTVKPTTKPTAKPTTKPTVKPSIRPSLQPTSTRASVNSPPTLKPSKQPLTPPPTVAKHPPGAGALILSINSYRTSYMGLALPALTIAPSTSTLYQANLWMSSDMAFHGNKNSPVDSLGRSLTQRLSSFGVTTTSSPAPSEIYYYGENCIDVVLVNFISSYNSLLINPKYKTIAVTLSYIGPNSVNAYFVATFSTDTY